VWNTAVVIAALCRAARSPQRDDAYSLSARPAGAWGTDVGYARALCRAARSPQRRRRGLSDEDRRATRARGIGRRLCASDLEQLITLGNEPCVRTES
jgi:hypothetical protein